MTAGEQSRASSLLQRAASLGDDAATLLRLATVRRSLGDLQGALAAVRAAARVKPNDFVILLMLASLNDAVGATDQGARVYRRALERAPAGHDLHAALAKQLSYARSRVAATDRWIGRLQAWQPDSGLTRAERERMLGFRSAVLHNVGAAEDQPPEFVVPEVPNAEFFDPQQFAGLAALKQQSDVIREEFLGLAEARAAELSSRLSGLSSPHANAEGKGKWAMIPLIRKGEPVAEYADLCPRTMALAASLDLPNIPMISPSLYFSVLEPGSRIAPHTGITNARLIVHIPLIVPQSCGIRVGTETRQWERGKALVFDDMTDHEAWNGSDRIRVVLIADLWRPELSVAERATIGQLMARELTA